MTAPPPADLSAAEVARVKQPNEPGGWRQRISDRRAVLRSFLVSLVLLIVAYAFLFAYLRPATPGAQLSLDTVNLYAQCAAESFQGRCDHVTERIATARFLDNDARIVGTIVVSGGRPRQFWTSYPKSDAATDDLIRALFAGNTRVTVDPQATKSTVRFVAQYLLPLVLLANLFAIMFYLMPGASGTSDVQRFGRVGDRRRRVDEKNKTTFSQVAGANEVLAEVVEVRDYLANPAAFARMGALPPKGILLIGPPGCGKTLIARAIAGETLASFYSMSGSEFVEALVGVGAARIRDLFSHARANSPAIIFIDELDAVGRQRGAGFGQGHDEREQTLNELLVQMDGFEANEGVVVIGATNRPDILDPALLRAGRFDRHVTVERPDLEARREILAVHARGRRLANADYDLYRVARETPGFTGADLANVMNEAALLAVRGRAESIDGQHLEEAIERVKSGPKRRGNVIAPAEKRVIAYHEAGHTVVAASLGRTSSITKVSIISRSRGVGHLAASGNGSVVRRRDEIEDDVAIAVAGFAAEELVFGQPSTGSEHDLQRATTAARDMAGRYGMSKRLGLVRVLAEDKEVFLGRDYVAARDVAQPTLEHLDAEVRRILDEQKELAGSILLAERQTLDRVATALIEQETLYGPELASMLGDVRQRDRTEAKSTVAALYWRDELRPSGRAEQ